MRSILWPISLLLLWGCATTTAPEAIREPPAEDLSLSQVRENVDAHTGRPVRWGGTIVGAENRPRETLLEIVARPLTGSGRPRAEGDSLGRFLARVDGFLDPAVYDKGRQVTVAGTVDGQLTRPIGEYPYTYVTVDAETTKLWEPPIERAAPYRDPFYYSPFYDPFYDPLWPARVYPWYAPYPFYPYWR